MDKYGGELAALTAALLWAAASVIYRRLGERIPPLGLNLLKGVLALAMLALALLATGDSLAGVEPQVLILLLFSGAVGIGLGDTAYFASLNALGARQALLLGILAPPMAGLLASIFLDERLSAGAWAGIALTVAGVAWVITERTTEEARGPIRLGRGVGFGLLAALAQAAGMVLARGAFLQATVSPLWAAALRLVSGILALLLWICLTRQPVGRWLRAIAGARTWSRLGVAVFFGTFLAVWLQQVALRLTSAGVTQALFSTSPLFVLPIAALLGERITARAVAGVILALVGVGLLFGLG